MSAFGKQAVEARFQSKCSFPLVLYCAAGDKVFRQQAQSAGGKFMLSVRIREDQPRWARELPCFADFDRRTVTYGEDAILRVLQQRCAEVSGGPVSLQFRKKRAPGSQFSEDMSEGSMSPPGAPSTASGPAVMSSEVQARFFEQLMASRSRPMS